MYIPIGLVEASYTYPVLVKQETKIFFFTSECENDTFQAKKERKRFMAAFVCEVVLDLAQCVWAELHFANYFPVAEFSAWRSSLALRREAQR